MAINSGANSSDVGEDAAGVLFIEQDEGQKDQSQKVIDAKMFEEQKETVEV